MDHNVILPWRNVHHLADIWIINMGMIPQEGRYPQIAYNYMCTVLKKVVL